MADYKHTLINRMVADLKMDLAEVIEIAVNVHTSDLGSLTNTELNLVMKYLQEAQDGKKEVMTKKIIHKLALYGMTDAAGRPDIKRINTYIKKIGSRNPKKKSLYALSAQETLNVLNQVSKMVDKEINK